MPIGHSIFREYDIRGLVPSQLNDRTVTKITLALGAYFSRRARSGRNTIAVGHDPRRASASFYHDAIKALEAFPQLRIAKGGMMTTPMLYYTVGAEHLLGGIMVTASHNPLAYNGIKAVREDAINLSGVEIEKIVKKFTPRQTVVRDHPEAKSKEASSLYKENYARFLQGILRPAVPLRIVVDCSNSPAGLVLERIRARRARFILINKTPDSRFPAHGPNPLKPGALEMLKRRVKKEKADFGAILDGDGDRIIFVDDKGAPLHPDIAAFLLMRGFKPPFVMDARTGWLVRHSGKRIFLSRVGHTNIKRVMRAKRASFAAETSGHFYFRNRFGRETAYNDSALQALMHAANQTAEIKRRHGTLDGWLQQLPASARCEANFAAKNPAAALAKLEKAFKGKNIKINRLDGLTVEIKRPVAFWFNIRPSANEPLLRLSLEAESADILKTQLTRIKKVLGIKKIFLQGAR